LVRRACRLSPRLLADAMLDNAALKGVDGQVVGAIGVSSDTPDHDEVIAKAGIAALSP
jgi:hypothetical protein